MAPSSGVRRKHRLKGNGFGFGLFGPEDVARTLSARYYKDGSEILIQRLRGAPRRLTHRECARLMGFDSRGRAPMRIPVSDTQATGSSAMQSWCLWSKQSRGTCGRPS